MPPGKDDIDPALNAAQSMVAVQKGGVWKIASFQNTPAAFHDRPDLVKKLAEELRAKLREMPVSKVGGGATLTNNSLDAQNLSRQ